MQSNADNLKSLKAFVSSHFMFNVLSKLQAEILKENKREALNTLNIYTKLQRTVYNICEESAITLKQEKSFLENYLLLEKMRFEENNLEFKITGFDTEKYCIEPFSIQPFVEFAVLSGIGHPELKIEIYFTEKEQSISIKSNIQNNDLSGNLSEKRKKAIEKLSYYHHKYIIEQVETRYLQKIYLNNEK